MSEETKQLFELIQQELKSSESLNGDTEPKIYTDEDVEDLKKRNTLFSQKYNFNKNDIVKWKKGLKNRKFPTENQPAIIVDILNPPLKNTEQEAGSPYFRESLDVILGIIDEKRGDFIVFHYDSRRFEPYNPE
jgi:hypothetical protein